MGKINMANYHFISQRGEGGWIWSGTKTDHMIPEQPLTQLELTQKLRWGCGCVKINILVCSASPFPCGYVDVMAQSVAPDLFSHVCGLSVSMCVVTLFLGGAQRSPFTMSCYYIRL